MKPEVIDSLVMYLPPDRPANPAPLDIPLESIPGTYVNDAYGVLVICSAVPTDEEPTSCQETRRDHPFPHSNTTLPTLLARFPKLWSTHLAFTHHNGSTFTVHSRSAYPGRNVSVVSRVPSYAATFNEEGMAWTGNAWDADAEVVLRGVWEGGLKEGAEVWFDRP